MEANGDEIAKMIVKNEENKPKLTIQKKEFNLHDNHDSFFNINTEQVILYENIRRSNVDS